MKLSSCPLCQSRLIVKEYYCEACDLSLKGDFEANFLEGLGTEQLEFIKLFLICGGNIKEMEKRLNISYPTVKNRLNEIVRRIQGSEAPEHDFNDIMNDLDEGFISVEEALAMIESRSKK